MKFVPWSGAGQGLAGCTKRDICCDDREDKPGGQEPPPVEFGCEVERYYPHLKKGHQLQKKEKRKKEQSRQVSRWTVMELTSS